MSGPFATRRCAGDSAWAMAVGVSVAVLLASPAIADGPGLHRAIPARGLVAYVEFDGLAAHASAWEATSAHAMLAKTPAGSMMSEVARQVVDRLLKMEPGYPLTGADLIALEDHVAHRGFAIAMHRHRDDVESWTVVINDAGRPGMRERFDRLRDLILAPTPPGKPSAPVPIRGRSVYQLSLRAEAAPAGFALPAGDAPRNDPPGPAIPSLSWWYEKDDLILISVPFSTFELALNPDRARAVAEVPAAQLAAVLDAAEGKQPDAATHPAYLAAASEGADVKGFEADGLFFIDPGRKGGLFGGLLDDRGASQVADLLAGSVPGVGGQPRASELLSLSEKLRLPPAGVDTMPAVPNSAGVPAIPAPPPGLLAPPPVPGAVRPTAPAPDPKPQPPRPPAGDAAKKPDELLGILGLDGVGRIVGRWGFQGKGLFTDLRIEAPGPRKGLVGLLDQPAFDRDRLPPIPRASASFVVDSFDPAAAYGRLAEVAKAVEPEARDLIDRLERATRDATGLRFREDILGHVGPTWCILPAPSAGGKGEPDPSAYVLIGGLKDVEGFSRALDALAERANRFLRDRDRPGGAAAAGADPADPPTILLERLPAPDRGYRLTSPSRLVSWLNDEIQPTLLVGRSYFALAANPERAREALVQDQATFC